MEANHSRAATYTKENLLSQNEGKRPHCPPCGQLLGHSQRQRLSTIIQGVKRILLICNNSKRLAILENGNFTINRTAELAERLDWSYNEWSPDKLKKQGGARARVMVW